MLYDYNARFYDPWLGRFLAADTIVPQPGNAMSLNRYMYTQGNPLRYVDPSGHAECVSDDCSIVMHPVSGQLIGTWQKLGMQQKWGIIMKGPWETANAWAVYEGMSAIAARVGDELGSRGQGDGWVRKNVGDTSFERWPNLKPFVIDDGTNQIELFIHPAITLFQLHYDGKYKGPTGFSAPQLGDLFRTSTIYFFDDMDETIPVHEVGHIVDYRNQSASSQMSLQVNPNKAPSNYGGENRLEDFAESWRFWVSGLPGLTPSRRNFMESLVVQAAR